jgi:hypothetical protein
VNGRVGSWSGWMPWGLPWGLKRGLGVVAGLVPRCGHGRPSSSRPSSRPSRPRQPRHRLAALATLPEPRDHRLRTGTRPSMNGDERCGRGHRPAIIRTVRRRLSTTAQLAAVGTRRTPTPGVTGASIASCVPKCADPDHERACRKMAQTMIGSRARTAELVADGRTRVGRGDLVARNGASSAFCDSLENAHPGNQLAIKEARRGGRVPGRAGKRAGELGPGPGVPGPARDGWPRPPAPLAAAAPQPLSETKGPRPSVRVRGPIVLSREAGRAACRPASSAGLVAGVSGG